MPAGGEADRAVVEAVAVVAQARGVPRAQIAHAWVARKQGVTAPIIGASKPHHLTDAIAALSRTDAGRDCRTRSAVCAAQRGGAELIG
ncbi:aldo/keto reductase family protein [Paraburkholderia rhizosphaerae]|uniref:Aldo/keto reductase family protein n=1 Tax=Paraburkholderia rhizosphaerae TaxID=480658 RepID=A0A4R8LVD7_9BURK|nr:aldo/keto reductase family protein [Paraburkholderia rhizosphaerae]